MSFYKICPQKRTLGQREDIRVIVRERYQSLVRLLLFLCVV